MDLSLIGGFILGMVLIIMGVITSDGYLRSFWDIASVFITLGGALTSTLMHYGFNKMKNLGTLIKVAMTENKQTPQEVIAVLVHLADKARRQGLLAIEEDALELDDEFLKNGIQMIVDGSDPVLVRGVLEIEMTFLDERHHQGIGIFQYLSAVSPAFGMIGTLIGLVIMLGNLKDPDAIGPGLAVALITTFYGSVLANLVFAPIAGKLKLKNEEEILVKEIMLEGILSIQQGENPRIIEHKLKSFLAPKDRYVQKNEALGKASEEVSLNA